MVHPLKSSNAFSMFGMGMGRRRPSPSNKYGSFNRRMFATTLDFAIAGLFIAPVLDKLFSFYYGPPPLDKPALQSELNLIPDAGERLQLIFERLQASGTLDYMASNMSMQVMVLLALIGLCWHFWAATPGKIIMRLKIVDAQTEKPVSDLQILFRLAGYLMSAATFLMGFFWIGVDKKRQGLHDKFAGTVVIALPLFPKKTTPAT